MTCDNTKGCACSKPGSHHSGLAVGVLLGLVAGYFIQSKRGKELTADAEKKIKEVQAQVMSKLEKVEHLTKDKYAEIVDQVTAYYVKSKDIAETEVPMVRDYFMTRWEAIQEYLKENK